MALTAQSLFFSSGHRRGFTLIELMVVIALMGVLAGLTVMFMPAIQDSQRAARAAEQVQGLLAIAKTRALRDGAPRGLRLVPGTSLPVGAPNPLWVTQCQFIEQPEDLSGKAVPLFATTTAGSTLVTVQDNPPTATPTTQLSPGMLVQGPPTIIPPGTFVAAIVSATQINLTAPATNSSVALPTNFLVALSTPADNSTTVNIVGMDLLNGYTTAPADQPYWSIQPGDYVEILGGGLVHRIVAVTSSTGFTVASPVKYTTPPTASFRIIRQPRLSGDEPVQLPSGIAIDLQTNATYPMAPSTPGKYPAAMDIMFSPSGAVITPGVGDFIPLWVRNVELAKTANPEFEGEPTIIAVFTKTGAVGAYPPDITLPSGNPYSLVK